MQRHLLQLLICLILTIVVPTRASGQNQPPAASSASHKSPPREQPKLIEVKYADERFAVGQLLAEDDETVIIFDLRTGRERAYKKSPSLLSKEVSRERAIALVGLPKFVAWRTQLVLGAKQLVGKIIMVTPTIYVNLGKEQGIKKDNQLAVLRLGESLVDPDTGENLGEIKSRIADLVVQLVQERFCSATIRGKQSQDIQAGDIVEFNRMSKPLAIIPLVDLEGQATLGGRRFAEEMTTIFVKRGVKVVERMLLDKAINELDLQRSDLFDPQGVVKLGKQLGASALIVGTITTKRRISEIRLRLIDMATGQILDADSHKIRGGLYDSNPALRSPDQIDAPPSPQIPAKANKWIQIATKFQGHSYLLVQRRATWYEARDTCRQMGGHLVSISRQAEQDFVHKLASGHVIWTGFSNVETKGRWRWVNREKNDFTFWGRGQPDAPSDSCAALWDSKRGEWHDALPKIPFAFVCEWDY